MADDFTERTQTLFPNTPPKKFSDGCPRPQCEDLEKRFAGKRRENYTPDDITIISAELAVLPPETILYALPTLMAACIQNTANVHFDVFIQSFIPDQKNQIPLASTLNHDQKQAVRQFLETIKNEKHGFTKEIETALKHY